MDAVEDIKQRLHIEDVIGEYIELKRAGSNMKGLSPFTSERTPSFMVSPSKQIWHDFSSNKGGDVFSFVMEMEGVDFKTALEMLARKAGIDVSLYQRGSGQTGQRKEKIYAALEMAKNYYQRALIAHKPALAYVRKQRGFEKSTITAFQVGYAPDTGSVLVDYLQNKGVSAATLKDAGLSVTYRGQARDMFRGRIIIPLHDTQGRVVGFTARLLTDQKDAPKYINTPSTLVYDKGRQLFGLHLAKQAIRDSGFVVLVEGNLDVVASHQAGVKNTVAVAGTALTLDHLKSLSYLTQDVRFAFDQDRAGIAATERAVILAQGSGMSLSVITLPDGKDPDELIRGNPNTWRTAIKDHQYVLDWLMAHYAKQFDITSASGKRYFSDKVIATLHLLQDPIEQEHYTRELAQLLGVSFESVLEKLRQTKPKEKPKKKGSPTQTTINDMPDELMLIQDQLLGLAIISPRVREVLKRLKPESFTRSEARELLDKLIESQETEDMDLNSGSDYAKIVTFKAEELYRNFDQQAKEQEAHGLVDKLIKERKSNEQKRVSEAIRLAESEGRTKELAALLKQYNALIREEDRGRRQEEDEGSGS